MKHSLLLTAAFLLVLLACTPVLAQDREEDPPATIVVLDSVQKNVQPIPPTPRTWWKRGEMDSGMKLNTSIRTESSTVNGTVGGYSEGQRSTSTSSMKIPLARFGFMDEEEQLEARASRTRHTSRATTAYPTELYYTDNIITFVNQNGIQAIEPIFDSLTESLVTIKSIGDLQGSPDTVLVHLQVHTVTQVMNTRFLITDAKGETSMVRLSNKTWRLDEIRFKDVVAGDTICQPFHIGLWGPAGLGTLGAGGEYLDSVSLPISEAWLSYSFPPPVQVRAGSTYRYNVCFSAPSAGDYKFAVITWMRRAQPAGGFINYPVADLALVHVLPKQAEENLELNRKE